MRRIPVRTVAASATARKSLRLYIDEEDAGQDASGKKRVSRGFDIDEKNGGQDGGGEYDRA